MTTEIKIDPARLSDTDPRQNIFSLNKSRVRAHYWREIGGKWVQTQLLPSDTMSRAIYMSKGFRMTNPNEPATAASADGVLKCPVCEMEADSLVSLKAHLNIHIEELTKPAPVDEDESIPATNEAPEEEPEKNFRSTSSERKKNEEKLR